MLQIKLNNLQNLASKIRCNISIGNEHEVITFYTTGLICNGKATINPDENQDVNTDKKGIFQTILNSDFLIHIYDEGMNCLGIMEKATFEGIYNSPCPVCNDTGYAYHDENLSCKFCKGKGFYFDQNNIAIECPKCHMGYPGLGSSIISEEPCPSCSWRR